MTNEEYESKKRELELKLKLLNLEQRKNHRDDEFKIFTIVACVVILVCLLFGVLMFTNIL